MNDKMYLPLLAELLSTPTLQTYIIIIIIIMTIKGQQSKAGRERD